VQWCSHCSIPIITTSNQPDKNLCPLCGGKTRYISADLRPVFPEERLLVEILLKKSPNTWKDSSVWACNHRYYVDGKSIVVPNSIYETSDPDEVAGQLQASMGKNSSEAFAGYIDLFIQANRHRLDFLKDEAYQFIQCAADSFDSEQIVVSFSGGKDSTVTADLAIKALSNVSAVIFDYTEGFRKDQMEKKFLDKMEGRIDDRVVYFTGVPVNPFKRNEIEVAGLPGTQRSL